jgi:hypothetical protein
VHGAAVGHQVALLVGVGKKGHGRFGVDQDEVVDVLELHARELGQVGNALHHRQARAALQAGGKGFGQQLHAAVRRDLRRREQAGFAQRPSPQQQRHLAARAHGLRHRLHGGIVRHRRLRHRRHHGRHAALAPGHVGRQDQRGHLPRQAARRDDGVRRVAAEFGRGLGGAHETRRDVARHGLDVGLQLGVEPGVVGGVVADDVHDRHLAFAGVVQVGQAVAQAAAQVQERGGGLVGHARIAIGRTGGHALEQGQHGAHLRLAVQRGHEVHLAGAGVGEADIDAGIDQRFHQGLGAIGHGGLLVRV